MIAFICEMALYLLNVLMTPRGTNQSERSKTRNFWKRKKERLYSIWKARGMECFYFYIANLYRFINLTDFLWMAFLWIMKQYIVQYSLSLKDTWKQKCTSILSYANKSFFFWVVHVSYLIWNIVSVASGNWKECRPPL